MDIEVGEKMEKRMKYLSFRLAQETSSSQNETRSQFKEISNQGKGEINLSGIGLGKRESLRYFARLIGFTKKILISLKCGRNIGKLEEQILIGILNSKKQQGINRLIKAERTSHALSWLAKWERSAIVGSRQRYQDN